MAGTFNLEDVCKGIINSISNNLKEVERSGSPTEMLVYSGIPKDTEVEVNKYRSSRYEQITVDTNH